MVNSLQRSRMGDIFFHTLLWCLWRDSKKRRQWWCETRLHLMVVSLFKACHQLKLKVNPNTWTNHVFLLDFRWIVFFDWLFFWLPAMGYRPGEAATHLKLSSAQKSKKEILQGFGILDFQFWGCRDATYFWSFRILGDANFFPHFLRVKWSIDLATKWYFGCFQQQRHSDDRSGLWSVVVGFSMKQVGLFH